METLVWRNASPMKNANGSHIRMETACFLRTVQLLNIVQIAAAVRGCAQGIRSMKVRHLNFYGRQMYNINSCLMTLFRIY